jgi:uncharacterized protein
MDYLLLSLGIILMILGLAGSILPVLPGPPLSYVGLLMLHFTQRYQFSSRFLILWLVVTVVVYLLDYIVPAWGAKKFGGSKRGVWGSVIGLVLGLLFFPPLGIIVGPFVGAVLGELTAGKDSTSALKSGFGSFVGFLTGTILKLIVSGMMTWYFFREMIVNG